MCPNALETSRIMIFTTIFFQIRYFSTSPGGSSQQALNSPIAVHGWAGTSPEFSGQSTLVWRLASLRLFDETSSFVPNSSAIQTSLGPEYVGNYQNTILPGRIFLTAYFS